VATPSTILNSRGFLDGVFHCGNRRFGERSALQSAQQLLDVQPQRALPPLRLAFRSKSESSPARCWWARSDRDVARRRGAELEDINQALFEIDVDELQLRLELGAASEAASATSP